MKLGLLKKLFYESALKNWKENIWGTTGERKPENLGFGPPVTSSP